MKSDERKDSGSGNHGNLTTDDRDAKRKTDIGLYKYVIKKDLYLFVYTNEFHRQITKTYFQTFQLDFCDKKYKNCSDIVLPILNSYYSYYCTVTETLNSYLYY